MVDKTEMARKAFCGLNVTLSDMLRDHFSIHGGGCCFSEAEAIDYVNSLDDEVVERAEVLG